MILNSTFILGMVVGSAVAWFLMNYYYNSQTEKEDFSRGLIKRQAQEKKENKSRIMEFLRENKRAANSDIKKLLEVSDATVTRYLDELEKEGRVQQIGKTGHAVFYTLK